MNTNDIPHSKNEYIVVRRSDIHHKGVFAKKDIPKGTRIIEYLGEKITKAESERRAELALERSKTNKKFGAVYIFQLNKKHDIDGDVSYNLAKYINHSCEPNCKCEIVRGKIWTVARKNIKKGEEITYNYGYDIDSYEDHPCRCGSSNCVGYILDKGHWPKLRKKLQKSASLKSA